jgi:hypothetical protein
MRLLPGKRLPGYKTGEPLAKARHLSYPFDFLRIYIFFFPYHVNPALNVEAFSRTRYCIHYIDAAHAIVVSRGDFCTAILHTIDTIMMAQENDEKKSI